MKLLINPQVYDDLVDIKNHIAEDNVDNANKVVAKILQNIEGLTVFPESGAFLHHRVPCDHKYRYIITFSYAAIYRIDGDNVVVTNVLHLKRDFSHLKLD